MPIDVDRFESADAPPTSVRIVRFLLAQDDSAYTRGELARALDIDAETVGTNLTRLKERGIVRHRRPYWTVVEDRDHIIDELRRRYDERYVEDLLPGGESSDLPDGTGGREPSSAIGLHSMANPAGADDTSDSKTAPASTGDPVTSHRAAASAFTKRVRDELGGAVEGVHLFGSVARDAATADSDVDVLVVVTDDADFASVDDRLLAIAYDVQLEFGVPVEVHSVRASEFARRREQGDPFIRTVLEEGHASE